MGAATAAVVAGGATIGSALIGANQAKKGREAAENAANRAAAQFANVDLPDIEKMELALQNPELVGEYAPLLEQYLNLSSSKMEDISVDQALKDQQIKSLTGLSEIADGGLTEADKAASREIQREVSQNAEARRQAILQNMAQRGTLGSGMELAAQLSSAQQAADQQSRAGDVLAQQAQARALQALQQSGNMAGQVRSQDFGEQSQVARAQDAINQWNIANQQTVGARNAQAQNQAQQQNLANRQALEMQRAQTANQQQIHNKGLQQQQFQNEMQKASGLAGAYQTQGQVAQAGANAQAQMIGGVGSGIGNIAGAFIKGGS